MKKEEKEKAGFYGCKSKCVWKEDRCLATGLKEYPSCHSILRSVCSKARCKVDGKKPKMLLPIAAIISEPPESFFSLSMNLKEKQMCQMNLTVTLMYQMNQKV